MFLQRQYFPLNKIEISKKALLNNYHYLSQLDDEIKIAPVLKSNAYGHGLSLIGKILDDVDAPFLCVDSLYEAYELFKKKIKTPILIMGYISPGNVKVKQLPFSFAVYNKDFLKTLARYQKKTKVHLFVETGLHREGIMLSELPEFLKFIKKFNNIEVEGLMSHLGAGENILATRKQIELFEKAKQLVRSAGFRPKWFHIAASSALLHHADYKNLGNLARCGVALYGLDPEGKDNSLQPVLKLKATLTQIKKIKKGEKVGYDFTYTAKKDITIGVLSIGYFDGVDRRLSNKGAVLLKDTLCPLVGRVSMNITTIDISRVKNPKVGDQVVIYSDNANDKNSFANAAKITNTISRDLLVGLEACTKRIGV